MADAIIVNGNLYIGMQQLTASYSSAENASKVAVFDVTTDTEVGSAIPLTGHNLETLVLENNTLYAVSRGDHGNTDFGAIDVINTQDNTVSTLIDGNSTTFQDKGLGHIVDLTIHDNNAYILGSTVYQTASLFTFDLTNAALGDKVARFSDQNITAIEEGPKGNLWVLSAVSSEPGVYKLDPSNATVMTKPDNQEAFIPTTLNPKSIVFVK